jgi:hypothetical protein
METFAEPIRYATTLCAIALVVTAARMLRGDPRERLPLLRVAVPWLAIATAAGLFFSHVTRSVPAPALVPAGALIGLGLGIAALCSPRVAARFTALDDGQWRMLMLFRAVFGALILAGGAQGLLPPAFALPVGGGDILVGALAALAPGSLAAGGSRASRLIVFGIGALDFAYALTMIVRVLMPWLAETQSPGLSLLLPWVGVPLMLAINLFGLRQLWAEHARARIRASAT